MRHAIGIDIGGTKIEGALINERGRILSTVRKKTESNKPRNVTLTNLSSVIKELLEEAKRNKKKVIGIGIGVPGPVPPDNILRFMPNIPKLQGINLQSYLKKRFKKTIICENDSNCFALAEAIYGAGKNKKIVIGVIWGTGLGCGIIINKKIYRGANGSAGEPGHSVLNINSNIRCSCGHYGDLESFTSAPNLIKHYKLSGGKKKNADSKYIMDCEDKAAKKAAKQAIYYLSIGLAFTASLLNPDVIILGGGISNSNHYKEINKLTNKYASPPIKRTFKITKYKLKDSSGVLGAATLVFC